MTSDRSTPGMATCCSARIRRGQGRSVGAGPYMNGQLIAERQAHGDAAWGRLAVKLHETEQLDDQLAGIAYVKTLPYVDPNRIAVTGVSFGGIQTVLAAERASGIRAAVDFAGAAMMWADSPEIRERMLAAVRNAKVPIYFIQAENDYNLGPSRTLAAEMDRVGKPHRMKIYPPYGVTTPGRPLDGPARRRGLGIGRVRIPRRVHEVKIDWPWCADRRRCGPFLAP